MSIYLHGPFAELWRDKDVFAEVTKLDGKVYRALEGRRTLRFEIEGKGYFLKHHAGVGWKEIFKNLLQGRMPILGADNEYHAVYKLQQLGVGTMKAVAYGCRGLNPAARESFIITEAIEPSLSLEELAEQWHLQAPSLIEKRRIIRRVATMAGRMHAGGVNHRDFYICHFLLTDNDQLSLIDLHRSLIHKSVPKRWLLKDLAGLCFSAYPVALTPRDKLRFIRDYSLAFSASTLRQTLKDPLWKKVEAKAQVLYKRGLRKGYVQESDLSGKSS